MMAQRTEFSELRETEWAHPLLDRRTCGNNGDYLVHAALNTHMPGDRKAQLKQLRDEFASALVASLARLKTLGFSRRGRSWKRFCEDKEIDGTDLVEFELTVLKDHVRVRMYEMRWVRMSKKTSLGMQTGRLEGTHALLMWTLAEAANIPKILAAINARIEEVSLPWFAAGGDPANAAEAYSLDDFCPK